MKKVWLLSALSVEKAGSVPIISPMSECARRPNLPIQSPVARSAFWLQASGFRCGVWCMVCGVWCVVCGVWCVVNGVWLLSSLSVEKAGSVSIISPKSECARRPNLLIEFRV